MCSEIFKVTQILILYSSTLVFIYDLVVVSVCDGIGVHASLLHFHKDSHSHDRKSPQATELHHYTIAHLVGDKSILTSGRPLAIQN